MNFTSKELHSWCCPRASEYFCWFYAFVSVAVSTTGQGEAIMKISLARMVSLYVEAGTLALSLDQVQSDCL